MQKALNNLEGEFKRIKRLGWIKGLYSKSGNVGKSFEKLLGIEDNTFEIPDYNGIEIKTKRSYSKSFTSLFNMTPNGKCFHEVERLKEKYGYPDSDLKEYKVLNNSVFCGRRTWIGNAYQFMLKVDRVEEKIFLLIFDIHGRLIEKDVNWDFSTLKGKLYRKMRIVAYISALRKFINKEEYFNYYKMELYYLKDFGTFIDLIDAGIIRISFRIGIFKNGARKGKIYDHGTSFNIKKDDFDKLFVNYKTIY